MGIYNLIVSQLFSLYWTFGDSLNIAMIYKSNINNLCIALRDPKCRINRMLFLPEASFGLRVLSSPGSVCSCLCVSLCVNHLLVRAITRDRQIWTKDAKKPWLRSLLFWEQLTLTFKVKFNSKVRIYPILSLSAT